MRLAAILAVCILPAIAWPADAVKRDPRARAAFLKAHPCPATGKPRGACPGYVVDHKKARCAGGPDTPENMQWQTTAEAKRKDRLELAECRALRKAR